MKRIYTIAAIITFSASLFIFCAKSPEKSETKSKAAAQKNMKDLDIKIVNKNDIQAVGITLSTSFKQGQSKKDIPPFFHKTLHEGTLDNVPNKLNQNLMCVFLVKPNSPDLTYAIAKEVSSLENAPDGMMPLNLPAATYASVEIIKNGHDDVAPVFKYILEKWTIENGYVPAKQPGFIYYDDRFIPGYIKSGYSDQSIATIFVPIVKNG
jgi:predicted transcriptional regulator YdeE